MSDHLEWHTEQRRIRDLVPFEHNPRHMTEKQAADLKRSLEKFNLMSIPVVDLDGRIVSGHQRCRILVALGRGDEAIDVRIPNRKLTEEEYLEANLRENKNLGEWDFAELANIDEAMLLEVGFEKDELNTMFDLDRGGGNTDPDEVPEPPAEPVTQPGDLYLLGGHRLLCGDATKEKDVEVLMGGGLASIMWTDPPYGVSYKGKTKDALTIDNDEKEGLAELLAAAFGCANGVLDPGAPFYIAHPAGALSLVFGRAIQEVGWRIHQTLVWVKNSMVLGHADYHYKHEPIYYGWTEGPGRSGRGNHEGTRWHGDHSQVSVFEVPRPKASPDHPIGKPVDLVIPMILNSSARGAIVYDPFLGSGTTMIAAEMNGRVCYGLEIDPRYCDVAVHRWENFTGRKAERIRAPEKVAT